MLNLMSRAALRPIITGLAASLLSLSGARAADPARLPAAATRTVDFMHHVRPIFSAHCIECHGPKKQKSDFRVDSKQIVLAGGAGGHSWQPAQGRRSSGDQPQYPAREDETV